MKQMHSLPENLRLYAVGDVHGRNDLLSQLLDMIQEDAASFSGDVRLIFLGDYIDRGHHSREVIDNLLSLPARGFLNSVFIQGNHEIMLREIIAHEDAGMIIPWLSVGGHETCLSYGVVLPQNLLVKTHAAEFIARLQKNIPQSHKNFFGSAKSHAAFGDYFFCHAGVRPKVPLSRQSENDLAWIREKFLAYNKPFEKMIIYGHTITSEPDVTPYRIGIDTGAYATGKLTALALEGTEKWFLQT